MYLSYYETILILKHEVWNVIFRILRNQYFTKVFLNFKEAL